MRERRKGVRGTQGERERERERREGKGREKKGRQRKLDGHAGDKERGRAELIWRGGGGEGKEEGKKEEQDKEARRGRRGLEAGEIEGEGWGWKEGGNG